MILAGDVGGTKTRLALYHDSTAGFTRSAVRRFESKAFAGLAEMVEGFLAEHGAEVEAACFGIPGPVVNGEVSVTNLPWRLSERELSARLGIPRVRLVNDLVATGAGVPHLSATQLHTLNEGVAVPEAPVLAVLAPGTGLGQAYLVRRGNRYEVLPSEGGHVEFSPQSDEEIALLQFLRSKYGHVSAERVISGMGIENIYRFLRDTGRAVEPPELAERMQREAPAAVVSQCALAGTPELCVRTLDMFARLLGAQAGNLVLTYLATGGVYLGGGVPPKVLTKLKDGSTLAGFLDKGRFTELVRRTPLHVILDDEAAVIGAAHLARELAAP